MAIEDAIARLPEYWAEVIDLLGPEGGRELRDLVAQLGGPRHDWAASRMADLLADSLPAGHPVRNALLEGDLYVSVKPDWPRLTKVLRPAAWESAIAEPRPGDSILRDVEDRVLQAPALTLEEVLLRGGDPAEPRLIRLVRRDGQPQWPVFQFVPGGGLRAVVLEVNELLGAAADPYAAADWWLSRNSWLGDRPSALIGKAPDGHLIRAARAVGSEI